IAPTPRSPLFPYTTLFRSDEPDVRPFRGLDGADAAVMRRMHIAHLEPRALPGQPPRTQRGQPTLVRDLRQWIRLVHELGELAARSEEHTSELQSRFDLVCR